MFQEPKFTNKSFMILFKKKLKVIKMSKCPKYLLNIARCALICLSLAILCKMALQISSKNNKCNNLNINSTITVLTVLTVQLITVNLQYSTKHSHSNENNIWAEKNNIIGKELCFVILNPRR